MSPLVQPSWLRPGERGQPCPLHLVICLGLDVLDGQLEQIPLREQGLGDLSPTHGVLAKNRLVGRLSLRQ